MKDAARWIPLRYYLRVQRKKGQALSMSFRQIEGILGDGLPKPARKYPEWWENNAGNEQARAWLEEGWQVSAADLSAESVVFTPAEAHPDYP